MLASRNEANKLSSQTNEVGKHSPAARLMTIPKLIHQTTADKQKLNAAIAENVAKLRALNPSWRYCLYDDDDIITFIRDAYDPKTVARYEAINPIYGAARADYFRYLVMLKLGGVYLDIKSTCDRPLDEALQADDEHLLSHWKNKPGERYAGFGLYPELPPEGEYQQWHIVSRADHPFLHKVISRVSRNLDEYSTGVQGVGHFGVLRTTGPIAYTQAISQILSESRFRIVEIESLGFRYSIFSTESNVSAHISQSHYYFKHAPIVLQTFYDDKGRR